MVHIEDITPSSSPVAKARYEPLKTIIFDQKDVANARKMFGPQSTVRNPVTKKSPMERPIRAERTTREPRPREISVTSPHASSQAPVTQDELLETIRHLQTENQKLKMNNKNLQQSSAPSFVMEQREMNDNIAQFQASVEKLKTKLLNGGGQNKENYGEMNKMWKEIVKSVSTEMKTRTVAIKCLIGDADDVACGKDYDMEIERFQPFEHLDRQLEPLCEQAVELCNSLLGTWKPAKSSISQDEPIIIIISELSNGYYRTVKQYSGVENKESQDWRPDGVTRDGNLRHRVSGQSLCHINQDEKTQEILKWSSNGNLELKNIIFPMNSNATSIPGQLYVKHFIEPRDF